MMEESNLETQYNELPDETESSDFIDSAESLESSESDEISESIDETSEENPTVESIATQEIIVSFDSIQLSENLNDIGLLGMALLIIILALGLLNVWGSKE